MLIHIVKTGETIEKITDSYRILKSDLISNNLHITDFSHLKSGMKLKIPLLSKDNIESLEESEAFIDDYYPSFEKFLSTNEKLSYENISLKEEKNVTIKDEVIDIDYSEEVNNDVDDTVSVNKNVEIIEERTPFKTEDEKVQPTSKNYNNNLKSANNYYSGNVIPSYNQKFIKKI